jgi:hypothetical protein
MSNPQTNYTVGELDLSGIFQPYTSGNNAVTGYKISSGQDLSGIFQPYSTGTTKAETTNYFVYNYNGIIGTKDLSDIFQNINSPIFSYTTNGIVSYSNPFVTTPPNTGYTYILFNSTAPLEPYYFNLTGTIPTLYYMIVGAGGVGQSSSFQDAFVGGAGGGAGGCRNDCISDFSANSYNITIPVVSDGLYTKLYTSDNSYVLQALNGQFIQRGSVNLNGIDLSPISSTPDETGVGGTTGEKNGALPGGPVYLGTNGSSNNYLYFLGDNLLSHTYFGGGGGGGAGRRVSNDGVNANGGDGGGGGGGGGLYDSAVYGIGGIGKNGSNGVNASDSSGSNGGSAFNSIDQGYGGGGGGGGSADYSSIGIGGNGGGAVLLLYFQTP